MPEVHWSFDLPIESRFARTDSFRKLASASLETMAALLKGFCQANKMPNVGFGIWIADFS